MVIKRVNPWSCGKIVGLLYAVLGFVFGAFISVISSVAGGFMGDAQPPFFGAMIGTAAIVVAPVVYGMLGFVTSIIGALLYNMAASAIGGIEVDIQ